MVSLALNLAPCARRGRLCAGDDGVDTLLSMMSTCQQPRVTCSHEGGGGGGGGLHLRGGGLGGGGDGAVIIK